MKEIEYKYMSDAQIAELDKLMNDGYAEVIMAYGSECMNYYKENFNRIAAVGLVAGMLSAGAVIIGKKVYHKLKNKEEPKPWDKPGRDWEV